MYNRFTRLLKAFVLFCLLVFTSQIALAQPATCYQSTPYFDFNDGLSTDTIFAGIGCVAQIPLTLLTTSVSSSANCNSGNVGNCSSGTPMFLAGISSHTPGTFVQAGTTVFLYYQHDGTVDSSGMTGIALRDTFCVELFAYENTQPSISFSSAMTLDTVYINCGTAAPAMPTVEITDSGSSMNCPPPDSIGPIVTTTRTNNGSCNDFEYTITRKWIAQDASGNADSIFQTIIVEDNAGPFFRVKDTTINCGTSIDSMFLGTPFDIMDNCGINVPVTISFVDVRDTLGCPNNVEITRKWNVRDICGNSSERNQIITIQDTIRPTFIVPKDTTVSCGTNTAPAQLGMPTMFADNCDANPRFSHSDAVAAGSCNNEETITRTWIAVDTCGNSTSLIQTISVIDTVGPSFSIQAMDLNYQCDEQLTDTIFTNWINNRAGAMGTDNCSSSLTWAAYNTGTTDVAALPSVVCSTNGTLRERTVDFVVFDECGKSDTTRAKFTEIDTIAPVITSCPSNMAVDNDAGQCGANITFTPPVFTDGCAYDTIYQYAVDGGARVTVDPIADFDLFLNVGQHQMKYYITDCGGNVDSCSFMVTVNDVSNPVVTCPANISVGTDAGVCNASVTIPFPTSFTDNCGFSGTDTIPTYYSSGVTTIANTMFGAGHIATHTFDLGTTSVTHFIADNAGNRDSCTFQITVFDDESPNAVCTPSMVQINPSGTMQGTILPADIDGGSTDNCTILNMVVQPNTITCDSIDKNVNVLLIVEDRNANLDTCATFVRVTGEEPAPAFNFQCGSDTLFLFANPPASTTGYTYRWFNPNNTLISTVENPEITAVSLIQSGVYCVEVEGLTGCVARACVDIPLDLSPPQPTISGPTQACWDSEDINLSVTPPQGVTVQVTYNWYSGVFPNGTLLSSTLVPSYIISAPHSVLPNSRDNRCFYVTTTINGCESQPSSHCLNVVRPPNALVCDPNIAICENEILQLCTPVTSNFPLNYQWSGPNTLITNIANPVITQDVDPTIHSGNYDLTISLDGCFSNTATTIVNVLDVPDGQPSITPLNQEICVGNTLTLCTNLTGVSSYRWVSPNGVEFSTNGNCLTLTADPALHNGPWKVYGIVSYSNPNIECATEMSVTANVVVNTFPQPIVAVANPAQVCSGGSVELQVTPVIPGASYVWTGPNGVVGAQPTFTLPNIQMADQGTYCVMVTNNAGCTKTECTQVTVSPGVEVVTASNNGPNCFSGRTDVELSLIVNPPDDGTYSYRWTGPCGFISNDSLAVVDIFDFSCRGTYCVEVTNGDGCVSNIECTTIDGLPPLPDPFITVDNSQPTYCAGEDICINVNSYSGLGQNITYNWVTTGSGFRTTNTPKLQIPNAVHPRDSGTIFLSVVVDGCQTSFSNILNIDLNPVPFVFAQSISPCEGGQIELISNYFPAGGTNVTYNWTTPEGGSFGTANPRINNADPDRHNGTYTLTVNRNGCIASDDVNVNITDAPMTPVPLQTNPVCLGSSGPINLCLDQSTTEVGAEYLWTNANDDTDTLGITTNICLTLNDLSGFSEGSFPVRVTTINNGCFTRNDAPMVIEFTELPVEKADAGADFTVCQEDDLILSAAPINDGMGNWEYLGGLPGVIIENPSNPTTRVTGLPPGNTYNFLWALSKGACENYSVDTVKVTIFAVETAFAGNDIDTCNTNTFQLNAMPSISGLGMWVQSSVQESLGVIINNPSDPNTTITVPGPSPNYFFQWVIPDQVCGGSSDEIIVKVAAPNAFAGADFDACGLGDVILNANPTPDDTGEWTALDPDIEFIDEFEPSTVVENLKDGLNTLVWTIDGGICGPGSIDTLFIDYSISPTAVVDTFMVPFGGTVQVLPGLNDLNASDFAINVLSNPTQGVVQAISSTELEYTAPFNFIGYDSMSYQICQLDTSCVCTEATIVYGIGLGISDCEIPSIITPNGDNMNENFTIGCLADLSKYPDNELIIFNQWGDEVYRAGPYLNDWFGTWKNEELPDGTYFYILDLGTNDKPMTGFLVIQR